MADHSPEPWSYSEAHGVVFDAHDYQLLGPSPATPNFEADAHRIVACVNACRHFSDEQLEKVTRGEAQLGLLTAPDPFAPEIVDVPPLRHLEDPCGDMDI